MRHIVRDLTFTEENPTLRHCLLSSPVKLVPRPLLPALRHQGQRFLPALLRRLGPRPLLPALWHQGSRFLPALLRRQYRRLFSIVLGHRTSHSQVPIYRNQSRLARERRRRRWEMMGRGREWGLEIARNWSENCTRRASCKASLSREEAKRFRELAEAEEARVKWLQQQLGSLNVE